jgi:hypothetical protein
MKSRFWVRCGGKKVKGKGGLVIRLRKGWIWVFLKGDVGYQV